MRIIGILMIVAGAVIVVAALAMNVTVAAPEMAYTDPSLLTGRVANWDLMGQRTIYAVAGCALFISGWIALLASVIRQSTPPPAA